MTIPQTRDEDRIRAIAYGLWLEEGRPEGRAEAHWLKALEIVNAEAAQPPAAAKARKAGVRKPAARKRS